MKKIGILTFHNACNYGAVLQAYALKSTLNRIENVKAEILDYRNPCIEQEFSLWGDMKGCSNPVKEAIKTVLCFPYRCNRNSAFRNFCRDYLEQDGTEVKKENLPLLNKRYSGYIVGSDQVWNLDITDQDEAFFLDFARDQVPRYSYAASIGKSLLSEQERRALEVRLSKFCKISFREDELVSVFQPRLPEKKMAAHLDPVFLLSAERWGEIAAKTERKPYVLLFLTGSNPAVIPTVKFAKKLAEEKGLDPVFLSDQDIWYKFRDWQHCGAATPTEFLGLIRNAEYIVTNSFHATAFSIIFHKKFHVETNSSRSGRILNILDITGLRECILQDGKPVMQSEITHNWKEADSRLESCRTASMDFLAEVVGELEDK